jgi:hypothetical protein
MKRVCQQGNDLMGEFQACQQLLNLPPNNNEDEEEAPNAMERKDLLDRLQKLEEELLGKNHK